MDNEAELNLTGRLMGRTAMGQYMQAHAREKRGHVDRTGTDDMVSHQRQTLRRYQEYFRVPSES